MAGADPSKAIGIVDLVFDLGVSINDIPTKLNNILNDQRSTIYNEEIL